jgi:hypothetical protein
MTTAEPPGRLDLESLPLHELAVWLRDTLIELVDDVLCRQMPNVQPKLSPFVINAILTKPDVAEGVAAFASLYEQLLKVESLPEATWRAVTEREIARLIGTPDFKGLPTPLWKLLGTYAWRDLDFQVQVAEKIETEIARRTLFQVGQFQTMLIAPKTCWLLLALACAHTLHSRTSLGKAGMTVRSGLASALLFRGKRSIMERLRPDERRVLELLQAKGEQFGLRPEWAGLWDQWLLLEAYRYWGTDWMPTNVRDALHALPLHQLRPGNTHTDSLGAVSIAHPSWAEQLERWFIEWNHMEALL